MFGLRAQSRFETQKVTRPAEAAAFRNIGHAASALRLTAKRSIRKGKKPGAEGSPPKSNTRRLPRSIVYFLRRNPNAYAAIGPARSMIGPAGAEHEHGRRLRDFPLPTRPFMGPALAKIGPRMGRRWAGSVH